jgi:peptide subunit release factor 1 (eRF1)
LARDLWQPAFFKVPARDHLAFEPKPDLAPLVDLMDEYERYVVAVVDKKRAQVYRVFMGEIETERQAKDFVPAKHDQGGVSQANYQRHHEAHVYRHLKPLVEQLSQMLRDVPFDRLVLAGPEEVREELADLLPKDLARRVVAKLPDMPANEAEVVRLTLEVEEQVERREENARLDHMLELAASGGLATAAVPETLLALWQRAVHTLVISGDTHAAGVECSNCGRLQGDSTPRCPACSAEMSPIHDIFERAIEQAVDQDSAAEILHGKPARRLQEETGGMGALLRFHLPVDVT